MKNRLFSLILAVCVTCSFALALSASAVVDGTPATDSVTADMFSPEYPAHPYALMLPIRLPSTPIGQRIPLVHTNSLLQTQSPLSKTHIHPLLWEITLLL